MTTDMFCSWNYVLEGISGQVTSVTARAVTRIPSRWDEHGQQYAATADAAVYGLFEVQTPAGDPVIAQINSSWAVRVYRDKLPLVYDTLLSEVSGPSSCTGWGRCSTRPSRATG